MIIWSWYWTIVSAIRIKPGLQRLDGGLELLDFMAETAKALKSVDNLCGLLSTVVD